MALAAQIRLALAEVLGRIPAELAEALVARNPEALEQSPVVAQSQTAELLLELFDPLARLEQSDRCRLDKPPFRCSRSSYLLPHEPSA